MNQFQKGIYFGGLAGLIFSATAWSVTAQDLGVRLELIQ